MNSDFYFAMGKSHTICEDYAYAGINSNGNHVAVISDGCSESPDTDFGSRYMVRSSVISGANIVEFDFENDYKMFGDILINNSILYASQFCAGLRLSQYCLDATLLYVSAVAEGTIVVTSGDGVVFARDRMTGNICYWNIDYASNSPLYANYLINENRLKGYNDEGRGERIISFNTIDIDCPSIMDISSSSSFSMFLSKDIYDLVGVISDGILTCNNMPLKSALTNLLSFKNYKGDFVKRRVKRFLKDRIKDGNYPVDDISMAVINLKDN